MALPADEKCFFQSVYSTERYTHMTKKGCE